MQRRSSPKGMSTHVENCRREQFISLKTLLFLHSHSDHIMAIAPTLKRFMYLLSIPCNQFSKILTIIRGGYKPEAAWVIDHIDRAKLYWKNRCLIVSLWWQNTHLGFSCQFRLIRLSFVRIIPRRRYQTILKKCKLYSRDFVFIYFKTNHLLIRF